MNRSIVSSLTILWLFVSCFTDATQVTGSLKNYILQRHNDARSDVKNGRAVGKGGTLPRAKSMNSLRWSSNLANTASQYAKTCPNNGACVHSTTQGFTPSGGWSRYGVSGSVGENIGCPGWVQQTTMTQNQARSIFNQMIDVELKKYSYQNNFVYAAGHYTQIIWAKTTQVGCGYDKCRTGWWLVCHYSPSGNYRGQYPYEKASGGGGSSYGGGGSSGSGSTGGGSSSSGNCVRISNINGMMNGNWYKKGTKNGAPYYKKGSYYLFQGSWGGYTTNTQLSDPSSYYRAGYCSKGTSLLNCDGKWVVYSQTDTNSRFTSCGALEVADTSCFDNYAQTLHFYADNSGEATHVFDRDDAEGCLYDQPVYKYSDYGMQYSLYFDGESEVNRWVIEGQQNVSNYRIKEAQFVCKEEDLYECTAGTWFEEVEYQDEDVVSDVVTSDYNSSNTSVAVPVSNSVELWVMEDAEIKAFFPKKGGDSGGVITVIVCVVVGILVLVASGYLVYRCRSKQMMNAKQMEIPDDDDEDEVEVTAPIHTDP